LRAAQRRQQQRGQNGDDGNHHQQFDQRESRPASWELPWLAQESRNTSGNGWLHARIKLPGEEVDGHLISVRVHAGQFWSDFLTCQALASALAAGGRLSDSSKILAAPLTPHWFSQTT